MKFREREFPHPVLDPTNRDVEHSAFQATCTVTNDNTSIYIDVKFDLSNATLKQLIETEKAHFVVHADCNSTFFRKRYVFSDEEGRIRISLTDVKRLVELSFFICAKEPLSEYVIEGMDAMYEGTTFQVNKGDILAYSEAIPVKVLDRDSLRKIASIMTVRGDSNATIPFVDYESDKIAVSLPDAQYSLYRDLKLDSRVRSILLSSVVLPVLVDAISEVLGSKNTDDYMYKERLWYSVLEQKISDIQQKASAPDSESAYFLAHNILAGVSEKAFNEVNSILGISE